MASGAERNNIWIKYCMALPRHILTSVMTSSVNAARVSGDYRLSKDNWRIGLSTYLSSSLGLATFKDTFWSSSVNPEHPFYYDCMIGANVSDPNVPWSVSYRYDGTHSQTSIGFLFIRHSLLQMKTNGCFRIGPHLPELVRPRLALHCTQQ